MHCTRKMRLTYAIHCIRCKGRRRKKRILFRPSSAVDFQGVPIDVMLFSGRLLARIMLCCRTNSGIPMASIPIAYDGDCMPSAENLQEIRDKSIAYPRCLGVLQRENSDRPCSSRVGWNLGAVKFEGAPSRCHYDLIHHAAAAFLPLQKVNTFLDV